MNLERSAEMDEALLALRSGSWLTVIGAAMLLASLVLNMIGDPAERLGVGAAAWVMLAFVLAVQFIAVLAVERNRRWVRRHFTADELYRVLWGASMVEGLALAIGVIIVPAALLQLWLMTLMMVVFAGYFYRPWQALSFIVLTVIANVVAVAIATPPHFAPSQFTPTAVVPLVGVTVMAGAFVVLVRRGRDRVERRARIVTAVGLAHALDLRDAYTAEHSETVATYAAQMAVQLGFPPRRVERVRLAGLVHDVGKIGIPDSILLKPGKLTDTEWEHMRRHPELGAQMLDSATLRDARRWVLAHHERPDGHGYPSGLSGDEIPIEARILAVADSFEAMTSDRVYRAGMPVEKAVEELRRCAGTQFDPVVVEAFVQTLPEQTDHKPISVSAPITTTAAELGGFAPDPLAARPAA